MGPQLAWAPGTGKHHHSPQEIRAHGGQVPSAGLSEVQFS